MIHGLGCGGDVWDNMKAALENNGWSCCAPTLCEMHRPRTQPPRAAKKIGLSDYIACARAVCSRIERDTGCKPIVIGHSMGGLIAQALAAEAHCSHAILVAPAPPKTVKNPSPWQLWLYANVLLSRRRDRYHKAWQ